MWLVQGISWGSNLFSYFGVVGVLPAQTLVMRARGWHHILNAEKWLIQIGFSYPWALSASLLPPTDSHLFGLTHSPIFPLLSLWRGLEFFFLFLKLTLFCKRCSVYMWVIRLLHCKCGRRLTFKFYEIRQSQLWACRNINVACVFCVWVFLVFLCIWVF